MVKVPQKLISRLSPAERKLRGRLARQTALGTDVRSLRGQFEETQANRELSEAAKKLVRARRAQGLPARITDPATLDRIAQLIEGATPQRKKPRGRRAA